MTAERAYTVLRNVPMFREVDEKHLLRIADESRFIVLETGEFIFHTGDHCNGFYITVRGNVKLSFLSMAGKEHVVRIIGPGQSFAEAIAFHNKPAPVSVQALSAATVLFIPIDVVFQSIEENPVCARGMLAGLSRRLHQLMTEIESLTLNSGAQRVIGYLLQNEAEASVNLPVSYNVIASHLNLTPESLSRILHSLSDQGLINLKGKLISINSVEKLREYGE